MGQQRVLKIGRWFCRRSRWKRSLDEVLRTSCVIGPGNLPTGLYYVIQSRVTRIACTWNQLFSVMMMCPASQAKPNKHPQNTVLRDHQLLRVEKGNESHE